MDCIHTIFVANIQKFRKQRDLTQEELAKKLDVTFSGSIKMGKCKGSSRYFSFANDC